MDEKSVTLENHLSMKEVWAFSVGTAVGWGSFVVTSNSYLLKAGPLGSVLGIIIGALVMLIMSQNFHYMMNKFPYEGGVYTYAKKTLGYDYGFLIAWFLILTYLAMFWANMTSIALFVRYFFGDILRVGPHYHVFGYEVYLPNVSLSLIAIVIVSLVCSKSRRVIPIIMSVMIIVIIVTITACFLAAMLTNPSVAGSTANHSLKPLFLQDTAPIKQILFIAFISPWAFIGFENISNFSEEFSFPVKKAGSILRFSVLITTFLYAAVFLLSVSAYPSEYQSWIVYINDLENLTGIKSLPGFYATWHYCGNFGIYALMISLMCLIITSLIGNIYATSRLLYALAKDGVISSKLAKLNKKNLPQNAIITIGIVSVIMPFLGRTTIGWIVDVTTIGATIIYGLLSYVAWKNARYDGKRLENWTGLSGTVLMCIFLFFLIVPKLLGGNTLAQESYFLFTLWSVIGLIVFHYILKKDTQHRFGKSSIVWLGLLAFVLVLAVIWMIRNEESATEEGIRKISEYVLASKDPLLKFKYDDNHIRMAMKSVFRANVISSFVVIVFFTLSSGIIISNFSIMKRREVEHEFELGKAKTAANTDPLTGVKSKHAYQEFIENLDNDVHDDSSEAFSIVVCDVNNLKTINDTQGHQAGDELIKKACHIICSAFSHSPVFRIGGDEFVVILRGSDFEKRHHIVESFESTIEDNLKNGGVVIASGISDFEKGTDKTVGEVFERADFNMYTRKKALKGIDVF